MWKSEKRFAKAEAFLLLASVGVSAFSPPLFAEEQNSSISRCPPEYQEGSSLERECELDWSERGDLGASSRPVPGPPTAGQEEGRGSSFAREKHHMTPGDDSRPRENDYRRSWEGAPRGERARQRR